MKESFEPKKSSTNVLCRERPPRASVGYKMSDALAGLFGKLLAYSALCYSISLWGLRGFEKASTDANILASPLSCSWKIVYCTLFPPEWSLK